ncbi:MAG: sugar ABC transporter ATP-binding protein [Nitrospinota bacterium]
MEKKNPPLLQLKGIVKRFPGVLALSGVDFDLHRGEVHVLLGENGAGKSTLIKIVSGVYTPDEGEVWFNGELAKIENPHDAMAYGIATIYQEFSLVPEMTVAENISLGKEPGLAKVFINPREMVSTAQKVLGELELDIDCQQKTRFLRVGEQQLVEIAKALSIESRVLILDEPTAALTDRETEHLFRLIRQLKRQGVGIIYISHRLEEIREVGDRVTVLRDGEYVGTRRIAETNVDELISMIVGVEIKEKFPKIQVPPGEELMRVDGLTREDEFSGISFSLFAGEVLAFAGLLGAGHKELVRSIFGLSPYKSGQIHLSGKAVKIARPSEAIRYGVTYLPADRKLEGLIIPLSVKENISLAGLKQFVRAGLLNLRKESRAARGYFDRFGIKAPSIGTLVRYLSGGNQQKVVLARSFCSQSRIFIFDEPTRGIDVGAKVEIYNLINELVKQGAGVILVSSELPEILGMCDRVLVMREGTTIREFSRSEATQERILQTIFSGNRQAAPAVSANEA